jgi:hypothetical protein
MADKIKDSEFQMQTTFIAENTQPQTESKLTLPGGQTESFWYTLGSQSTVPFVQLVGGGMAQKIFTWGELIEVPPGQKVIVKNASLMRGDIIIESGKDYAAKPRRITIPVAILDDNGDTSDEWDADGGYFVEFPCDARNAHQAFFDVVIETGNDAGSFVDIFVFHSQFIHTYTSPVIPNFFAIGLDGFTYGVVQNSLLTRMPLGLDHQYPHDSAQPMSMLDQIDVLMVIANPGAHTIKGTAYYTLNY